MNKIFLPLLFLIFYSIHSFAQTNSLEVVCFVESATGSPIDAARAELFENGTKVKTATSDAKGIISFNLDFGKDYKIVVTKQGMIQKRIDFKTEVSPEFQRNLRKEFAMSLVENCDGADVSVFSEPVDFIQYDAGFGNFVSDKAYADKMQSRFASAYQGIEKCKQDKFQEEKLAADKAFNEGNFEESIKLYQEALKVYPNDAGVKRQIAQAQKNITTQQSTSARYDQLIKEGDQFLAQNNPVAAKQRYVEAQKINPAAGYPQQKINEINNQAAQQQAELQKQQATNEAYNDFMKQGNAALAAKNYPLAQQMFEKASAAKPGDLLASQKVAESQQALKKQQQDLAEQERINKAYDDALANANASMAQTDYLKAQEHYKAAMALKPNETLPRQKLAEAQKLEVQKQQKIQADQKAEIERKYNEAIASGNALFAQSKYNEASAAYEQALSFKPADPYAQQQIGKIKNLIVEAQQAQKAAVEKQYTQDMALGESKKLQKDYPGAITAFQQALLSKPNDTQALSKLAESEKLLAEQKKREKEDQEVRARYNQLVQEGDGMFQAKNYESSKVKYQEASQLYPAETYPRNQLATIENLLAGLSKEAEYIKIVTEGDQLFGQQNWEGARSKYSQAQTVMPEKTYPAQKLNEINQKINEQAKLSQQAKYSELAQQAEQQVDQKNYEQAKTLYNQAMLVMPENPYPQKRINEINQMISNESKNAIETRYNELVAQAEKETTNKNYDLAKNLFGQAQQVMPEKTYPQQRINEINKMISDASREQLVENYNKLVAEADQQFASQNYEMAVQNYNRALALMPEQTYPQQKLNEISALQTERSRQKTEQQEIENQYNMTISLADRYFNEKSYSFATTEYNKARQIKPSEVYPAQQIEKINQLVAEQQLADARMREAETKYKESMSKADSYFKARDYANAKIGYQDALNYKPGDAIALSQIQRIDQIANQEAEEGNKQKSKQEQYNALIGSGDKFYSAGELSKARQSYYSALELIPGQEYPRNQIRKIDEAVRASMAKSEGSKTNVAPVAVAPVASANAQSNSSTSSSGDKAQTKFSSDSERDKYLEQLKQKYSEGVTKETYSDNTSSTTRYVIIRSGEVKEFVEVRFKWGGAEYTFNGKAINDMYFNSQVKPREGESFTEIKK
ncbi:MAG: tetratricopeptide repeat protein [Bacteroidota bacterium]|nr:MAG: tetratricopeptide repeat protein [Bacteroidota bacterium]